MTGFLNGGPYHGHGFEYPPESAVRIHDPDAGGLLAVMRLREPGASPHVAGVHVRGGTRFPDGALARAIYRDDPDMTRIHGWLMLSSGKRHRIAVFTFDREWTERL